MGRVSCNKGKTLTEEHRAKISAANMGKSSPFLGIPRSEETIMKLKGKVPSEYQRRRASDANSGKVNALNIETGIAARIPADLYHSRRDIYLHTNSKVYKAWKTNQLNQQ